jgi:predicted lipid-binding transport protein (Tim44 family)
MTVLSVALVGLFLWTGIADARVGGGGSFSGGGGGSSGGGGGGSFSGGGGSSGGGGGGEILIWLLFKHPVIGVPLLIVVVIFHIMSAASKQSEYSSAHPERTRSPVPQKRSSSKQANRANREKLRAKRHKKERRAVQSRLNQIRRYDPNFSEILFMDFAYALYAKVQEARGQGDVRKYSPYLTKSVVGKLQHLSTGSGQLQEIRGVIVGAASIERITSPHKKMTTIRIRFETNYTEVVGAGKGQSQNTFYCEEVWQFTRLTEVLSPPPEKIANIGCPSCGSPLERKPDGSCHHCGVRVKAGKQHWMVNDLTIIRREPRGPLLTSDVPEVGTNLPTVLSGNYQTVREKFLAAHRDFAWQRTEARFRHIFAELQQAWTSLKWERARPYESDQLFQFHQFWMHEYETQKLRNVLEDIELERLQPVRMKSDTFYDAITVRIWANMKDYTVDSRNRIVCGDPNRDRRFTEYWTFMRRRGVKESAANDNNCPNCGGDLKINMSGICEYCDSKVTSGEFDWVLSRIEQDEAYVG